MNLNFDTGYRGEPETVSAFARNASAFPGNINSLLSGCMEAYKEGRPDNLQQMLSGFLDGQMKKGINAGCQRDMTMHRALACKDAGDRLAQFEPLTDTAASLMGDTVDSAKDALNKIFAAMSDEQRQYALNLTLLYVTREGGKHGTHLVDALLESGAKANTHQGDAIGYAAIHEDREKLKLLYIHNGDFSLPEKFTSETVSKSVFETLKEIKKQFEEEGVKRKPVATRSWRDSHLTA